MPNRWNIPTWLEREVLERDRTCVYCGTFFATATARRDRPSWEHIVNDTSIVTRENIALCCIGCNASKGTKTLAMWLQSRYCLSRGISSRTVAPIAQAALAALATLRTMHISVSPPDFHAWPELFSLLQNAFAYMDARIDPPSSLQRMTVEDLRNKAKEETLIVATEGAELIGCAFVAIRGDCAYVGKVAVAERGRGKGVARALMAAAERVARLHERPCLELQTRIELLENHKTFAALGFEKVAETAHPGYNRPTSITMRKWLSAGTA